MGLEKTGRWVDNWLDGFLQSQPSIGANPQETHHNSQRKVRKKRKPLVEVTNFNKPAFC